MGFARRIDGGDKCDRMQLKRHKNNTANYHTAVPNEGLTCYSMCWTIKMCNEWVQAKVRNLSPRKRGFVTLGGTTPNECVNWMKFWNFSVVADVSCPAKKRVM